jgi:Helix-turn-helix domain
MILPDDFVDDLVARIADAVVERLEAHVGHGEVGGTTTDPWRLLTTTEAASLLGRSTRTVHSYLKRGLPYISLDGKLAFDPDDVRAWARAHRIPSDDDERLDSRLTPPATAAKDRSTREKGRARVRV